MKMEVQQAVAVSITADMWTSVNMEADLALTRHYINENLQLCTSVLGVHTFHKLTRLTIWPKSKVS